MKFWDQQREARSSTRWLLLAFVLCLLLSFGVESLQNWLPRRVPSNVDWLLNTLGGTLGAMLAWVMGKIGALDTWGRLRQSWFVHDAQEGLVLLLLAKAKTACGRTRS